MANMLFHSGMETLDNTSELASFISQFDLNRPCVESPIQETFSTQALQQSQAGSIHGNPSESHTPAQMAGFLSVSSGAYGSVEDTLLHTSFSPSHLEKDTFQHTAAHVPAFLHACDTHTSMPPSSRIPMCAPPPEPASLPCYAQPGSASAFAFQAAVEHSQPPTQHHNHNHNHNHNQHFPGHLTSTSTTPVEPSFAHPIAECADALGHSPPGVSPPAFPQKPLYPPLTEFGHSSFSVDYGVLDLMAGNELVCELSTHSPQEWPAVVATDLKRFHPRTHDSVGGIAAAHNDAGFPREPFLDAAATSSATSSSSSSSSSSTSTTPSQPFFTGCPVLLHTKEPFTENTLLHTSPFLSPFPDTAPGYSEATYAATFFAPDGFMKNHGQETATDMFVLSDTHPASTTLPDTPTSMYSFDEHPASVETYASALLPDVSVHGGLLLAPPALLLQAGATNTSGSSVDIPTPPTSPQGYGPSFHALASSTHPMYVFPSAWAMSSSSSSVSSSSLKASPQLLPHTKMPEPPAAAAPAEDPPSVYTPALFPASLMCPDNHHHQHQHQHNHQPSPPLHHAAAQQQLHQPSSTFQTKRPSKLLALLDPSSSSSTTALDPVVDPALSAWLQPTYPFAFPPPSSSVAAADGEVSGTLPVPPRTSKLLSAGKRGHAKRTSVVRMGAWGADDPQTCKHRKSGATAKKDDAVARTSSSSLSSTTTTTLLSSSSVTGAAATAATSMKLYSCARCEKSFKRKADCIRHGRIHTGEKPYKCPGCSESFARQDALRRHQGKGNVKCANALKQYITVNSIAESPEAASLVKHGHSESLAKKWMQTESHTEIPMFL